VLVSHSSSNLAGRFPLKLKAKSLLQTFSAFSQTAACSFSGAAMLMVASSSGADALRAFLSIHLQASHAMLGTPIPRTLNDGILHGYAAANASAYCDTLYITSSISADRK
jgi:hypothetical protein